MINCNQISLHHSFNVFLAKEYGVYESIMIHHFQFWIQKNIDQEINFHEGKFWTYQTLEEIKSTYPYMSIDQVKRLIQRLCQLGVLRKGNFNQTKYDRTVWYAFEDDSFVVLPNELRLMHLAKSPNGKDDIAGPIPDSIPDTKKDITKVISKEVATAPSKNGSGSKEKIGKGVMPGIELDFDAREFKNLKPEDLKSWKEIYPIVDLAIELKKMIDWCLSNGAKGRKRNWRKFITNWLKGSQEKIENRQAYVNAKNFTSKDSEENKALGNRAFDLISSKTTDAYFVNGNPTLDEHYFAFGGGYGRPDARVVLKFSMPKAEFAEGIYKLIPSLRPKPKEAEPTEAQREEARRQSIELQTVRIIPSKKEEPVVQMPEETEAEKEEIRKALNEAFGGTEFKTNAEDGVETKADTLSTIVDPNRPILEHFNPTVNRRMVLPKTDEQKARRLEAIAKLKPVNEFMMNLPLEAK